MREKPPVRPVKTGPSTETERNPSLGLSSQLWNNERGIRCRRAPRTVPKPARAPPAHRLQLAANPSFHHRFHPSVAGFNVGKPLPNQPLIVRSDPSRFPVNSWKPPWFPPPCLKRCSGPIPSLREHSSQGVPNSHIIRRNRNNRNTAWKHRSY